MLLREKYRVVEGGNSACREKLFAWLHWNWRMFAFGVRWDTSCSGRDNDDLLVWLWFGFAELHIRRTVYRFTPKVGVKRG